MAAWQWMRGDCSSMPLGEEFGCNIVERLEIDHTNGVSIAMLGRPGIQEANTHRALAVHVFIKA